MLRRVPRERAPSADDSFAVVNGKMVSLLPADGGAASAPPLAIADCLKLNNNNISSIAGLPVTFAPFLFMGMPRALHSLDLSFNRIAHLDPKAFASLPNLGTLLLHSNAIADWQELDVLAQLSRLDRLSLQVRRQSLRCPRRPFVGPTHVLTAHNALSLLSGRTTHCSVDRPTESPPPATMCTATACWL